MDLLRIIMCDEDYWRKEAERLFSLADVAKIKRDFLVFQRDEARHIARVLYRLYLASQIFTWDEWYQKLIRQAKRELPWL